MHITIGQLPHPVQPRRSGLPSFVYFAKHKKKACIKIGFSANLSARIAQLSQHHGEVELIAAFPGTRDDEQRIHDLFGPFRLRLPKGYPNRTEWFRATADILSFGAKNTVPLKDLEVRPYHPQRIAKRKGQS